MLDTPGTPEMGELVAELVDKHNTILMANHGVVSWSHNNVEDAYFKMEILEAYCRTILVTAQVGKPAQTMTPGQLQEALNRLCRFVNGIRLHTRPGWDFEQGTRFF